MAPSHLQFICPHCDQVMRVPAQYLGQRGKCNRCDGKVRLEGNGDDPSPQLAVALTAATAQDSGASMADALDAEALQTCWLALAPDDPLPGRDAQTIREALQDLLTVPADDEPISGKTRSALLRLGLEREVIDDLGSETKARQVHEELHLQPTVHQRQALHALGINGAAIAAARSRGLARLLIESRLSQQG